MPLHPKQIESVLRLSGQERYEYFLKIVADKEEAWGLYSEGWALAKSDNDNGLIFPIWPAPDYAILCAVDNWANYEPKSIDIDDLLDGLLPSLHERKTELSVFPTPLGRGVTPKLEAFESDLKIELSKFEFE
jgi:hypothetical protein